MLRRWPRVLLFALGRAAAAPAMAAASPDSRMNVTSAACTGTADPPASACWTGAIDLVGITESLTMKIDTFAGGAGTIDVTGAGFVAVSCLGKSFTKSGQEATHSLHCSEPHRPSTTGGIAPGYSPRKPLTLTTALGAEPHRLRHA